MTEWTNRAKRYELQSPIRYRTAGSSEWRRGQTANISRSGVLFSANDGNHAFSPGDVLEMVLTLTPEGEPWHLDVTCQCAVVRQAQAADTPAAVAMRIVRYRMGSGEIASA